MQAFDQFNASAKSPNAGPTAMTTHSKTAAPVSESNPVTLASICKVAAAAAIVGIVWTFAVAELGKPPVASAASFSTTSEQALAASRKAVEMNRHLLRASPILFEAARTAALADSLDDLSLHLAEVGDNEGARRAVQESVALRSRLANNELAARSGTERKRTARNAAH
jgi:hypothetical protein